MSYAERVTISWDSKERSELVKKVPRRPCSASSWAKSASVNVLSVVTSKCAK
jgi:hypothetical protein